jgi:hypothetical protein
LAIRAPVTAILYQYLITQRNSSLLPKIGQTRRKLLKIDEKIVKNRRKLLKIDEKIVIITLTTHIHPPPPRLIGALTQSRFFSQSREYCLVAVSLHATKNSEFLPIVAKIVHFLYETDLLNEDAILEW